MGDTWRDEVQREPIPPQALRSALEGLGLLQRELAEAVGVDTRSVRRWLAGDRSLNGVSARLVRLTLLDIEDRGR